MTHQHRTPAAVIARFAKQMLAAAAGAAGVIHVNIMIFAIDRLQKWSAMLQYGMK